MASDRALPACCPQAVEAVTSLHEGNTVIVNVQGMESLEEQQRAVDFLAGGCYALAGEQEMLAEGIFVFTPEGGAGGGGDGTETESKRNALISLARASPSFGEPEKASQ